MTLSHVTSCSSACALSTGIMWHHGFTMHHIWTCLMWCHGFGVYLIWTGVMWHHGFSMHHISRDTMDSACTISHVTSWIQRAPDMIWWRMMPCVQLVHDMNWWRMMPCVQLVLDMNWWCMIPCVQLVHDVNWCQIKIENLWTMYSAITLINFQMYKSLLKLQLR